MGLSRTFRFETSLIAPLALLRQAVSLYLFIPVARESVRTFLSSVARRAIALITENNCNIPIGFVKKKAAYAAAITPSLKVA